MNEKDYRKRIGKKLEDAYLSQPMGETPSKETFAKWIEIAEQKRAERRRHRRKLVSCAAALVMCVVLGVACIFDPPQVAAGGKGGSKIEANLETSDVYKSYEELPEEVKDEFLLFTEMLQGYSLNEVRLENTNELKTLEILYENNKEQQVTIEEIGPSNDGSLDNIISPEAKLREVEGIDVYVRQYTSGAKEKRYVFIYNNVLIKIGTPSDCNEEDVFAIIKKAVLT